MSPVNEMIPWVEDADRIPCQANGGAVVGKRFVIPNNARLSGPMIPATAQVGASDPTDGGRIQAGPAAANGPAIGVASWDAAAGEGFTAVREGILPVTADGAITAGDRIIVGAAGKAKSFNGVVITSGADYAPPVVVGIAADSAVDAADAQILLTI